MSSSAINAQLFQAKIGSIQNQADSSGVYSAGVWSFKNSTALTSVTITDAGAVTLGPSGFTGNHVVNGNVGIGTASKITGLESFTQFTVSGANGGIAINSTNTAAGDYSRLLFTKQGATGNEGVIRYNTNDYHMGFFTNSTERMRIDAAGSLKIAPNSIQGATTKGFSLRSISTDGGTNSANTYCTSRYGAGKFVVLAAFDPSGNSVAASTAVGAGSTFIVLVTDAASNY